MRLPVGGPAGDPVDGLVRGEGGTDVAHDVAVDKAVEMEERQIQLGAGRKAPILVPRKGRTDVAILIDVSHVTGEWRDVMGHAGRFQHRFSRDFTGGLRPEALRLVPVGRDDGELCHDEPVEMLALRPLPRPKFEDLCAKIRPKPVLR